MIFQSTHPRGVRRKQTNVCTGKGKFQSTHPRGVRPAVAALMAQERIISIHAPAWGATAVFMNKPQKYKTILNIVS